MACDSTRFGHLRISKPRPFIIVAGFVDSLFVPQGPG